MSAVRAAIIGLGYFGPQVLRNFAATEGCEVVLACDKDEKALAKVHAHYPAIRCTKNADEVFDDPSIELVLIATPTASHFALAKRTLESGKHAFVEKPLAGTSAECAELNALAKKTGKHLFVDHTFMFAPAVRTMADMAVSGELGTLLYYDSVRINLGLIRKDANVLWDLAVHDLSILATFRDLAEVTHVCAYGSKHYGSQVEDSHLHLRFKGNFEAHIHVGWLSPAKLRRTVLAGSVSMVSYDDIEPSEKIRIYDRGVEVERDDSKPDPFFPKYRSGDIRIPALDNTETLLRESRHVIACIRGEEKPVASGLVGEQIVRLLEIADQSLNQEKGVEIR